ncbi:MAG: sensor histidine kinase [Dermatophilaceae bacterium]
MPEQRSPAPPPPLGWWGHTWRLVLVLVIGLTAWTVTLFEVAAVTPEMSVLTLGWLGYVDPLLGLLTLVLTFFRRRWPLAVAVVTTVVSTVSTTAAGPATLALGSLATRRRTREIVVVTPLTVASSVLFEQLYPESEGLPLWAAAAFGVLYVAVIVAIGLSVGADRERVAGLRERAETAEREQQARVAAARAEERTRIAREMHDVLAHRMSLVSMHAGALTFRDDLPREQQVAVAQTIEENAHLALRDLRDVLGVLRSEEAPSSEHPERPQPDLDDLPRLVDEARQAGMTVTCEDRTAGEVPTTTGRTVYRIVQEALTNARKHAPGATVAVTVGGAPGDGLEVVVANPLPVARPGEHPRAGLRGAGLGLLGLAERVDLLGGTLASGPDGGRFVVRASLPWPA